VTRDPQILAAVALLRSRDTEIAALKETAAVQAVQIRWLKQLLAQQDVKIDAREPTISELYADLFGGAESPPDGWE
jgi:hypothetical protein